MSSWIYISTNSESTLSRGFQIRYFHAGNFQYGKSTAYRTPSHIYNLSTDYFIYNEATESSKMQLGGEADVSDIITIILKYVLSRMYTLQRCLCLTAGGIVQ
jgi:hypothetical protein